ncbi:phage tail terminator family protein [Faecalispora anaeroviscerum]|uniref:phage tail terminator family protein n=1 Tax=Faecalispora anaeroviscerum TaxID=2991836 RepID=UPI0024BBD9D9|nr:hypothetical protein [Faecalispora anaeroviscerum]
MMDIFNMILSALSVGLDGIYPDIPVYTEWVPDKLPARCFLIGFAGDVDVTKELGGRVNVSGKLDITYLPPEKTEEMKIKKELNKVFATISLQLRQLTFSGCALKLRNHTRHDDGDELHDLCDFTTLLHPVDETPKIKNIDIDKGELK